jgi:hypothetical protein
MRFAFIVTETLIIAIISLIAGFYVEKQTNVTNYIYQSDLNKTTILWIENAANK